MPRIYVLSGPDLGRTFDVVDGATFGRTADCAVTLRDASVSRTHARLERDGAAWRVVDAGSRNGLFVGTERVASIALEDGDEFRLGEVVLRFRAEIAAISAPGSPAPPTVVVPHTGSPSPKPERAAPAEMRFETRGPSRGSPADEPVEIELEGDWGAAPPARLDRPTPRPTPESVPSRAVRSDASVGAPTAATAAPRSAANEERARKLAAAGIGSSGRGSERDARGVLQFHKVAQADGVLRQDLGQQSTWLRTLVLVLIAGVMVALAWFGYQAATTAKSQLVPTETLEDETLEDEAR